MPIELNFGDLEYQGPLRHLSNIGEQIHANITQSRTAVDEAVSGNISLLEQTQSQPNLLRQLSAQFADLFAMSEWPADIPEGFRYLLNCLAIAQGLGLRAKIEQLGPTRLGDVEQAAVIRVEDRTGWGLSGTCLGSRKIEGWSESAWLLVGLVYGYCDAVRQVADAMGIPFEDQSDRLLTD